ncbi:twin-arginine translocation signal domain-containing protein [Halorubrum sp. BOL3-1]|uniref:DUF6517 family protein n=1 Tax=Halorubrum sp. BOL3-1 TaxID=2497325 RepID=UPI00100525D1|nr:DUF6517 family protein [Halorubrum sp. BOL3-1]QAU13249.1 twin-arginine translocation signal domain-containing protein [Halorubrum sp. BOL3-1]
MSAPGATAPASTRRAFLGATAAATAATAGCALLPEEPEPIEASADEPTFLPDAAASDLGSAETIAEETTLTVSITVDLSGDVQLSNTREVIATVYRRGYAADGRQFGVVTAPAVAVIEQPEVVRDPVAALSTARSVELATGAAVSDAGDWSDAGSRSVLGNDVTASTTTATADGTGVELERVRVRAGDDAVTAIAVTPDGVDGDAPFGDLSRDA